MLAATTPTAPATASRHLTVGSMIVASAHRKPNDGMAA
jgi:hypothetical protein